MNIRGGGKGFGKYFYPRKLCKPEGCQFNEAIFLSLTKTLKLLFNCEVTTLCALDKPKRELFAKYFHLEGFPENRLIISVKNIAGFVAATGKLIDIKSVKDSQELFKYHKQQRIMF